MKNKLKKEITDLFAKNFLEDELLAIDEYVELVNDILHLLNGKKVYIRKSISKVNLLGFDAIIILNAIKKACEQMLSDLESIEEYELCALLRDTIEILEGELWSFG